MEGHFETLAGVLRIGGKYGEPFTWAAAVRFLSPVEVEIMAVLRAPTRREAVTARNILRRMGVERAFFVRYENGHRIVHAIGDNEK